MARRLMVCVVSDSSVHAALCESRGRALEIIDRSQVAFESPDSLLIDHDPAALATVIADAVAQVTSLPIPVTLVIPMQWCFVHALACVEGKNKSESLGFELERFLPLPLEEVACAFGPRGAGQVFAAALPIAPMEKILEGLTARGVTIDHITVDVFAATQGIAGRDDSRGVLLVDTRWERLLCQTPDTAASVGVFGRRPHKTTSDGLLLPTGCENGTAGTARGWPSECAVLELAVDAGGVSTKQGLSRQQPDSPMKVVGQEAMDLMVHGACSPSLLDLRTGVLALHGESEHLARRAAQVLTTALVLIVLFIGGTQLRLRSLRTHLDAVDQQRLAAYRQAFDADHLPPEAALRVASERVRLEGLTRHTKGSDMELPESLPPPLDVLRSFVAGLPTDVRLFLTEARVDDNQLILRGQTVEHRDAERIAEAVNASPGLDARPPRTTRVKSGGVEFSIAGGSSHGP